MKTFVPLLSLCVLLSLSSCKEKDSISFTEPQPANMSDLQNIPSKFRGLFKNPSDSTVVSIDESVVVQWYSSDVMVHHNELSPDEYFSEGFLVDRLTAQKMPAVVVGDSLKVHVTYSDTIFDGQKGIARKSNGALFLNRANEPGKWTVRKITLNGKTLSINKIAPAEADEHLPFEKVAEDSAAGTQYHASKRQFKRFVRKGRFKDGQMYVRIN